jgi:hypothetical protein
MNSSAPGKSPSRIWRTVGLALLVLFGTAIAVARFAYSVMAYAGG